MRPGSGLLSCGGLLQANDIIAFYKGTINNVYHYNKWQKLINSEI
jgi:hypothetical protein